MFVTSRGICKSIGEREIFTANTPSCSRILFCSDYGDCGVYGSDSFTSSLCFNQVYIFKNLYKISIQLLIKTTKCMIKTITSFTFGFDNLIGHKINFPRACSLLSGHGTQAVASRTSTTTNLIISVVIISQYMVDPNVYILPNINE